MNLLLLRLKIRLQHALLKNSHGVRLIRHWWREHGWHPVCFMQGHVSSQNSSSTRVTEDHTNYLTIRSSSRCDRCGRDYRADFSLRPNQFLVPKRADSEVVVDTYEYLSGKSGQTLHGGVSTPSLVLKSTAPLQKGQILFGDSQTGQFAFDETEKIFKCFDGNNWISLETPEYLKMAKCFDNSIKNI